MRDKRILMLYRESCIFKPHARRASFPGIAHGSHIFFFCYFLLFSIFIFVFAGNGGRKAVGRKRRTGGDGGAKGAVYTYSPPSPYCAHQPVQTRDFLFAPV